MIHASQVCCCTCSYEANSVGRVGNMFESVCLFVCFSVCLEHNSKTNDPKVFKLGIGMV